MSKDARPDLDAPVDSATETAPSAEEIARVIAWLRSNRHAVTPEEDRKYGGMTYVLEYGEMLDILYGESAVISHAQKVGMAPIHHLTETAPSDKQQREEIKAMKRNEDNG